MIIKKTDNLSSARLVNEWGLTPFNCGLLKSKVQWSIPLFLQQLDPFALGHRTVQLVVINCGISVYCEILFMTRHKTEPSLSMQNIKKIKWQNYIFFTNIIMFTPKQTATLIQNSPWVLSYICYRYTILFRPKIGLLVTIGFRNRCIFEVISVKLTLKHYLPVW